MSCPAAVYRPSQSRRCATPDLEQLCQTYRAARRDGCPRRRPRRARPVPQAQAPALQRSSGAWTIPTASLCCFPSLLFKSVRAIVHPAPSLFSRSPLDLVDTPISPQIHLERYYRTTEPTWANHVRDFFCICALLDVDWNPVPRAMQHPNSWRTCKSGPTVSLIRNEHSQRARNLTTCPSHSSQRKRVGEAEETIHEARQASTAFALGIWRPAYPRTFTLAATAPDRSTEKSSCRYPRSRTIPSRHD